MNKENAWLEDDSTLYQQIAPVAVPARAEQLATLLALMPFAVNEAFTAVELACGEGLYSAALLDAFPQATVVALDGSPQMRERAAGRLSPFSRRAVVRPFDILKTDWLEALAGVDCVFSSLCVHHLDAEGKRCLFAAIFGKLSARGALLIADLVQPQRPEARALFADSWESSARQQSLALTQSVAAYDRFVRARWNHYRHPDPYDTPSPLFDQLLWLKEAGFGAVDCFWMRAGHAIYGGYKRRDQLAQPTLSLQAALAAAQKALPHATSGGPSPMKGKGDLPKGFA